ncbi:hypothetical protein F4859DRAFT_518200 [Xylaria cf. heliscus]|nr:hypothetical protein F4859DRAFT_518200 [Xylaria cf. heliscus]
MLYKRCQAFDIAKDGYSFCALLEEHLLQRRKHTSFHRALTLIRGVLDIRRIRTSVNVSPLLLLRGYGAARVHVEADSETPAGSSGDSTGHFLGRDVLSANAEKFILKWHQHCRENHPDCNKTLSQFETIDPEAPVPSRCVEKVRSQHPKSTHRSLLDRLQGLETREITKRTTYGRRASRSLSTNYLSRATPGKDSSLSDEEAMPPLFRDVCIMAARLGVFFVWIDLICIVQDDPADWRHEADDADGSARRISFKRDIDLKTASIAKILKIWRRAVEDYSGSESGCGTERFWSIPQPKYSSLC